MSVRLEVHGLSVEIAGRRVVDGLDLTIGAGGVHGLAGESGSGKTIASLAILGLLPRGARASGEIVLDGQDLGALDAKERNALRGSQVAMVFQDPSTSLHPQLSVETQLTDHLRHHRGASRRAARVRAAELLREVRLPEPEAALRRYPHQFSGGQRQRIAIAVAIACEPSLLLADEPTTALDVTVQAGILRTLRRLVDEHDLAVLLVTHDLGVLSAMADDVTVMRHGAAVETAPRERLFTDPQHAYTRDLLASLPGSTLGPDLGGSTVLDGGGPR